MAGNREKRLSKIPYTVPGDLFISPLIWTPPSGRYGTKTIDAEIGISPCYIPQRRHLLSIVEGTRTEDGIPVMTDDP